MIKLILIGLWVCSVTAAACVVTVIWQSSPRNEATRDDNTARLASIKTRAISVPIISGGSIQGYVFAEFAFNIDQRLMKNLGVKPDGYLVDEAFKTIYGAQIVEAQNIRKPDLAALSQTIRENANKRFGVSLVEDVLVQEFNYIVKDAVQDAGRKTAR